MEKTEYCTDSMQYLIVVFFVEIGLYPFVKINISKWLFNNKIYNLFLIKCHEIFLKHTKKFTFKESIYKKLQKFYFTKVFVYWNIFG